MLVMRTQVAIVGSGPSGLLLSQILAMLGIESVIVENRSQDYVLARIRAGVIEHGAVDVLTDYGVADRLHREGMRHDGVYLQWPGQRHRVDFVESCGRSVWVYGQTEITKDLIGVREADGQRFFWEVSDTAILDVDTDRPRVTFLDADGNARVVEADYVAGCDGFHGVSRQTIPESVRTVRERVYPYAWLGILAQVAPSTDELIYALHPDGFAMHSMRSHEVSRLYLQVAPDDVIESWSDDRIWDGLSTRMAIEGWSLQSGPTLEKSITPMRSFVSAPMRWGRLLLAGDASHIVPPTGAKGLNLAIADVKRLGTALARALNEGQQDLLDRYSDDALERVWQSTHFSWWMTSMLHMPPASDPDRDFLLQMQLTQLHHVTSNATAARGLAENYTGAFIPYP
jgi:p-hydroxybenzoate 3-monooxygenase